MDDVQQLTGTIADMLRMIGHELTSLRIPYPVRDVRISRPAAVGGTKKAKRAKVRS